VKSLLARISTISISPERGHGPKRFSVGIIHIAWFEKKNPLSLLYIKQKTNKNNRNSTRPNPIAAGHFSAYLDRAVSKAERVNGAHPGGLNRVDDVFVGSSDDR
jgi:hypothetical protein